MTPRQHYLDLVADVANVEDEAPDAIAGVELLSGDLLRTRHEALGAIDLDDQRPALVAVTGAGHDLTLTLGELLEQAVPLVLAELLDHHLLGRLGRYPTEALERDVLTRAVFLVAPDLDGTRGPVHVAAELLGVEGVEVLACSADHRLLEVLDEQVTIDVAIAGDRIDDSQCVRVHVPVSWVLELLSFSAGSKTTRATSVSLEIPVTGGFRQRRRAADLWQCLRSRSRPRSPSGA